MEPRKHVCSSQLQQDNSNIFTILQEDSFITRVREVRTGDAAQGRETTRGKDGRQEVIKICELLYEIL